MTTVYTGENKEAVSPPTRVEHSTLTMGKLCVFFVLAFGSLVGFATCCKKDFLLTWGIRFGLGGGLEILGSLSMASEQKVFFLFPNEG